MSIINLSGQFAIRGEGERPWELATLFPAQGSWTVDEYFQLTDSTNRLIEFTDGRIEVLEMPTVAHQRILAYLFLVMQQFVSQRGLGEVLFAGLRLQLDATKFREPDIVFLKKGRDANVHDRFWNGADLVLEVVSGDPGSRDRDLVKKRADYAAAGIGEYWIVDPEQRRILVLALREGQFESMGEYHLGSHATSAVLAGFAVDVSAVFKAADGVN